MNFLAGNKKNDWFLARKHQENQEKRYCCLAVLVLGHTCSWSWAPQPLHDIRTSRHQDFRTSGHQDIRTSGHQDFRTSGLQDIRTSELQKFVYRCISNWIYIYLKMNSWWTLLNIIMLFGQFWRNQEISWGKCSFPARNFLVPNFLFSCQEMCHSSLHYKNYEVTIV